jgi:hypothetical protein
MVEWTTPRKAVPLRTALDVRAAGGSVKKLCLERTNDDNFPSQSAMSRWINRYDLLAQHNLDTTFEEACRRTGKHRTGRPPALSANALNEIGGGSKEFRERTR